MSCRILLVDDDSTLRSMTAYLLEAGGYDVKTACSGVEAVGLFKPGKFDAIITDLVMPDMDGLQLIRTIRAEDKAVYVIAISGGSPNLTVDYLPHAKIFGANVILTKPIVPFHLQTLLDEQFGKQPRPAVSA